MALTKVNLLDKAYEITKAYASSNGSTSLEKILRDVYEELKKINEETDK